MKKVLICILQLHKNSGSARTAQENIRYYISRGFEVHVASMTLNRQYVDQLGAIPHKLYPWIKSTGLIRRRWYNFQVARLKKKIKPDLVVGHGDIDSQDILHLHNCVFLASELIHHKPLDPANEMAQVHGTLLERQDFKLLIANSHLMKNEVEKRFGVPDDKVKVFYPSLETSVFFPKPDEKSQLRARFGFPDKIIVSLVTSGNFKKRGLDIFNEAIKLLPKEISDLASFRLVGKDNPGELCDSGIILDPPVNDIENYFNAIDVFVLPARIEEFGRVVIEALGCGLPAIVTDKVGACELINGQGKDFIISSENPSLLAQKLQALILDKELRHKLGSENAETAKKYSESNLFTELDPVFKNLFPKLF